MLLAGIAFSGIVRVPPEMPGGGVLHIAGAPGLGLFWQNALFAPAGRPVMV